MPFFKLQEAVEQKQHEEVKKKAELAAAVKAAVITEAAAAQTADILKASAELVTDATPAPSVETLMKEATGTLRKATVTSEGDLKEELIDKAPILIDKAEVMQVINVSCICFCTRFSHCILHLIDKTLDIGVVCCTLIKNMWLFVDSLFIVKTSE